MISIVANDNFNIINLVDFLKNKVKNPDPDDRALILSRREFVRNDSTYGLEYNFILIFQAF